MSKAFTKESDTEADEALVAPPRRDLPPGTVNYITAAGAAAFREELSRLAEEKKRAAESAAPGTGDSERRKLLARINQIEQILQTAVEARPPADQARVGFGAAVTVRHANRDQVTYRIVGVDEAEPDRNEISWISPLARQLMKRQAGDKFRFRAPAGEEDIEILQVKY